MTLKAKLQTLLNIMDQKEREFITNTKLLKDQYVSKEEDYKTQIRNLKSTQQIEVEHLQTMIRQMEGKILVQEQKWRDLEEEHKRREGTSHEFILSLQKEVYDIRQVCARLLFSPYTLPCLPLSRLPSLPPYPPIKASAQRDIEWRFWGQRCHKLETENGIIRNELGLMENEGRRLREISIFQNNIFISFYLFILFLFLVL